MSKIMLFLMLICLTSLGIADTETSVVGSYAGYTQARYVIDNIEAEIAVGGSAQINNYVDFRGIVSINIDGYDDEPRINIGLFDIHTPNNKVGIRLGRVQNQFGFYSSAFNWAPARDMHWAPQGIYREDFRYMMRSGDGIQAYTNINFEDFKIYADVAYIRPVYYPEQDITKSWNSINGKIDQNAARAIGGSIEVTIPKIKSKFKYDLQHLDYTLENTTAKMFDGSIATTGHYFGGKTELTDSFDFTYEYLIITKDGASWDKSAAATNLKTKDAIGYGLSIGYQITEEFKIISGYSAFYNNKDDKHGTRYSKVSGILAESFYQEDLYVGVKYRRDKWISTFEVHHLNGVATIPSRYLSGIRENNFIFTVARMF